MKTASLYDKFYFPDVSLLITHYNRSSSLQKLLLSFEELKCAFGEIIVSDDGSRKEHVNMLTDLAERFQFRLTLAEENGGLGNNINKGQDLVSKKYTLYVQEDFVPTPNFPEKLKHAFRFLDGDQELDIVRFYAYIRYPYLKQFEKGFSTMYLPKLGLSYTKLYQYSDHPHLRRSTFLTKFGRYKEGLNPEKTEYEMCISFIKNKGKGLFFNDFKKLFVQENTELEPSTMKRGRLRRSDNLIITVIRDIYRQVKNNYYIYK